MLPAFLPSWLQDFSGTAAAAKAIELLNGSLFPLLFVLPVAVVALLLIDRNSAAATEAPRILPDGARDGPPVQRRPRAASDAPTAPQPAAQTGAALVLIADDSAVVRGKLSRLLGATGFRVVAVADGQQALDLIQDGQMMPSVLITDLEMPGLDGFELIAAMQGAIETEHLPIIAITGHDDLRARVADLTGVYGIFKKPWNDRELLRRVEALVDVARKQCSTA